MTFAEESLMFSVDFVGPTLRRSLLRWIVLTVQGSEKWMVHRSQMHLKNKIKTINTYVFCFIYRFTKDIKWACSLKQKWAYGTL